MAFNEIIVEELIIKDKEGTIYGMLYRPAKAGVYPAVIFSHGYNGAHTDFENECRFFAQNGYLAYAYDFCGSSLRSKSSGDTTEMTLSSEKGNLLAVFDALSGRTDVDGEHIFLFGASQGGCISALAAAELGGKVKAIALYFPALCIPDDWQKKYKDIGEVPDTFEFWGLTLGKGFVEDVFGLDIFGTIKRYRGSVLLVHGDADEVVPFSYSEKALAVYPDARLVRMEREGHGFSPEGGKRALGEVAAFFGAHTGRHA